MDTDSETWERAGPPEGQSQKRTGTVVGLLKGSKDWSRTSGSIEKRQGRYKKGNVYQIASLERMGLD
jgi:hypothetical protein